MDREYFRCVCKQIFNFKEVMKTWYLITIVLIMTFLSHETGMTAEMTVSVGSLKKKQTLVIGKVTTDPKKLYRYLKPMVEYTVKKMKNQGIIKGRVLMAGSNGIMNRYLKEGKVDWVTATPYSSVLFAENAGMEIFLKKWKKEVPDYYSIFFSRTDSKINSLEDLKGKIIAFEDAGSTSAHYEPAAILLEKGFRLVRLNSPTENVPTSAVGYLFSGSEITSSTWVYKRIVNAAALNNIDWTKNDHLRRSHRKEFTIFYQNKPLPRAFELLRKDLDPALKKRLQEILLNAHKDPEAKLVLDAYQKTLKFEKLDNEDYTALKKVKKRLKLVDELLKTDY